MGVKWRKRGSSKDPFTPHPQKNNHTKTSARRQRMSTACVKRVKCYVKTRNQAYSSKKGQNSTLVWLMEQDNSALTHYVHKMSRKIPIVQEKDQSNLNKFLFVVVKTNLYLAFFSSSALFRARDCKIMMMMRVHVLE